MSYAKDVIDLLKKKMCAPWGVNVTDICEQIWHTASTLQKVDFVYIPRPFTIVVHCLEKFSDSLV